MIEVCNQAECDQGGPPVDCVLAAWAPWKGEGGLADCVDGQQFRTRAVEVQAANGGEGCKNSTKETQGCTQPPTDCVMSQWSVWDDCDKSCGGGQKVRHRQVHVHPTHGGATCSGVDDLALSEKETHPCNEDPCNARLDCELSEWSGWQSCDTTCGVGQQKMTREITQESTADGLGCSGETEKTRACADNEPCSVHKDCVWDNWSEWSGCTCDCDGGQKRRQRQILTAPTGSGKLCDPNSKQEITPCNTQPCGSCVNARWSDWSPWRECTVTCEGGMQVRERNVERQANDCGEALTGAMEEYKLCNTQKCVADIDCVAGEWADWSACSCTCHGTKHRSRTVQTAAFGKDAKRCGNETNPLILSKTAPCNVDAPGCSGDETPVIDCHLEEWQPWTTCSVTCGAGQTEHSREIANPASNGGAACEGDLHEIKECSAGDCPGGPVAEDCVWGEWSHWGACTKCSGQQTRHRNIVKENKNGGQTCEEGSSRETRGCEERMCHQPSFCTWDHWADWAQCSVTCGSGGSRTRIRRLALTTAPAETEANRLYAENEELRKRSMNASGARTQEIAVAFSAGMLSLVALFAAARSMTRRSSRVPVQSTFQRTPLSAGDHLAE